MRSWIYLFAAIFCEVIGTSAMKFAGNHHAPWLGYLVMYAMIGLSYYFLALAVKKVPVGVAYALWEGIGIVLITCISVLWFGELVGLYKGLGLGLIIMGILMIKAGTKPAKSDSAQPLNLSEA